VDRSDALRSYRAEWVRSAPNVSDARFTWEVGTGSAAPAVVSAQLADEGRADGGFAGIFADLSDGDVTLGFLMLSLLVAFAFGAQHALGPGHGKTMVAAYLVGSRGTPKHAVALGLTVTATHTSTVYLLGAVTLLASAWLTPEKVYLWMGVAAGVMVVGFGLALLVQRTWSYRKAQAASGVHRHGLFGKAHSHESPSPSGESEYHAHSHGHHHEHDEHGPDEHHHGHEHAHEHAAPFSAPASLADSRVTWRSLLSLGVLGGLLPCPSAVVVMVAAISQGQVLLGMLLIVAFSLGLAGVLMAIGVSLVLGRRVPARQRRLLERPFVARAIAVMPVVSAVIVTVVGLGLTYQAVGRV
jgi:ABC-type nickel/cobalt efflux system permease component RcnA